MAEQAAADIAAQVKAGYAVDGLALQRGALVVDGKGDPDAQGANTAGDGEPAPAGRRRDRYG